jgi:hypothetical protein
MEGYTQSEYHKFIDDEEEDDDEEDKGEELKKKKIKYTPILKEEEFDDD